MAAGDWRDAFAFAPKSLFAFTSDVLIRTVVADAGATAAVWIVAFGAFCPPEPQATTSDNNNNWWTRIFKFL